MKFNVSLIVLSSLPSLVLGTQQCSTAYASTSTSRVPTSTKTTTITKTTSATYGTTYVPSSTTISYTIVAVSGKNTKTVPTGPSFTPIISAPKGPPPEGTARKRQVRRRAAPTTRFPSRVFCTTTQTSTTTRQIPTATSTYTAYATAKTFTSTSTVATSTFYAACNPTNMVSTFQGNPVNYIWSLSTEDVCDYNEARGEGMEACANAVACCNYAQANDWAGFAFSNTSGKGTHCTLTAVVWGFETGETTGQKMIIGNGPEGSGYFGPPS